MKKLYTQILHIVNDTITYLKHKLFNHGKVDLTLISTHYHANGRYFAFTLTNNYLLDNKQILKSIFNFLMSNHKFKEFGNNKIIIVKAVINQNLSYMLHPNILLTNNTIFKEYYSEIKDNINTNYSNNSTYPSEMVPQFEVLVWNMDDFRNTHIKRTKSTLSPYKMKQINTNFGLLKPHKNLIKHKLIGRGYHTNSIKPIKKIIPVQPNDFAAMDIETMEFNDKQIPIAISIVCEDDKQLFIIKLPEILETPSVNKAVEELWSDFFAYILNNNHLFKTIFLHNLGSFDGYFSYKFLSNFFEPSTISTIIDHHNKFIKVSLKIDRKEIVFLDSLRIFDVELEDLCKNFKVKGKISKYNQKFNNLNLFKDDILFKMFKEYSLQDSIALYQALVEAQKLYISQYNVDITSILSTSTLSLKIFRQNFLKTDIPILKGTEDNFIRKSYFGGHTDYYQEYARNIYYYDINSLYPFAMCKPMPYKLIKYHSDLTNIKLENFFGFCLAEVTTPKNILKPLLPYKHEGKTIFPTGSWIGVYFSEELLAVKEYGYKINLINGYEYSQVYLFNDYVDHFYNKKKNSTGGTRFIAKMHLNQLYGIFGRKQEVIETINIYKHELPKYLTTKIIKSIIEINEDIITILIQNNINSEIIKELNIYFESEIHNNYNQVKSNVALASAVTSYARICMMPYIDSEGVVYTDTDSIFTTKPLNNKLVGKELGLMKDELEGNIITEGYFFGIKQYSYYYKEINLGCKKFK